MAEINLSDLQWYQSTAGPQTSATVKAVLGLILPVLKNVLQAAGVPEIGTETADALVDAVLVIGFAAWALHGHIRARKALTEKIGSLEAQIMNMGGTPK